MPIHPHQPVGMGIGGIIAVDDGDLVAMAHGAQDHQQVGAEQGIDTFEHQTVSLNKTSRSSAKLAMSGRLPAPISRAADPMVPGRIWIDDSP